MPECNQTQITVSNAGYTPIIGNYQAIGTQNGFTAYYKDGITSGNYFRIILVDTGFAGAYWAIFQHIGFGQFITYQSQTYGSANLAPTCPTDPSIVWSSTDTNSYPNPVPIISETVSAIISPQQRRIINLRKQLKLGNKKNITLK
jgi:hypothetical protein